MLNDEILMLVYFTVACGDVLEMSWRCVVEVFQYRPS